VYSSLQADGEAKPANRQPIPNPQDQEILMTSRPPSNQSFDRRSFLKITGTALGAGALYQVGAAAGVDARSLALMGSLGKETGERVTPFSFVQFSDTHVGFQGPPAPMGTRAFEQAVATVNALPVQPDLILFTGDLTHDSEKEGESAARMKRFQEIAAGLKVKNIRCVPGEHDAGLDGGALYRSLFGPSHYAFDHRGVHFVALDNVSMGKPVVGPEQTEWLRKDLARFARNTPIVVFTHRPLFDLKPEWEWYTGDGDEVMNVLAPFANVTVLYGHIHRLHAQEMKNARHFAARSLIFAFPDPEATEDKKPLPFDGTAPFRNLGLRRVAVTAQGPRPWLEVNDVALTLREYAGTVGINQMLKGGEAL
jgi:predicted phosphodiesterase